MKKGKRMSVPKNWDKLSIFQKKGYIGYYLSSYRELSSKLFSKNEWLKMVKTESAFKVSVQTIFSKIEKQKISILRNRREW